MNRRPFLLVLTALLVSLALVSGTALAQTPKRGGTLRVSYGNEIAPLAWCSTHRPPPSSAASRTASRASRGAG